MNSSEKYVRDNVEAVYGRGSTVDVYGDGNGGLIRVLGRGGKRVMWLYWDSTRVTHRTQEQAWLALSDAVRDDERSRRANG